MRKSIIISLIILTIGVVYFFKVNTNNNQKNYKVGVVYLLDHPAIQQGLDGFKEGISQLEKKHHTKIDITYSNAYGEIKNINSILSSFKNNKKDIIIALTTPCAQVSKKVIKKIPTIFVGVTDPIQAGLIDSLEYGKENMIGTTSIVPYEKILSLYKKLYPKRKRIGIVYSQQEANSLVIIQRIKEIVKIKKLNLEIISKSISNTSDIHKITASLSNNIDSFMIINDSAIVSAMKIILKIAKEKDIPVFASDIDTVKGGALFTFGLNYKDEGLASAQLLDNILFKAKLPSEMKVYINDKSYLYINKNLFTNNNLTEKIKANATIVESK